LGRGRKSYEKIAEGFERGVSSSFRTPASKSLQGTET